MAQYLIMFYRNITDGISPYKVVGYKLFLCINIYLIFGKIVALQNVWINVIPNLGTLLLNSTYMGLFSFKNCLFRYLSFINFFVNFEKKRLIKHHYLVIILVLLLSTWVIVFCRSCTWEIIMDIFHIQFVSRYNSFKN